MIPIAQTFSAARRVAPHLALAACIALAACLALAVAAPRLHAQDVKLRYGFEPGKSWRYKMVEKQKGLTQSSRGMSAEINRTVESYFTVTAEQKSADYIVLLFAQDTAIVEDLGVDAAAPAMPDYANALTKKPVRLTMSLTGEPRSAVPTVPLRRSTFPAAMTDNLLARRAFVLPALPARALRPGMSWTESASDTSMPSQTLEGAGNGKGLRLASSKTTFTVEGIEDVGGHPCLKIRWTGGSLLESKMIFPATELFTEEETTSGGTMYFSASEGLLVHVTVTTTKESTRVVHGRDQELAPSSSTLETSISLLPPR